MSEKLWFPGGVQDREKPPWADNLDAGEGLTFLEVPITGSQGISIAAHGGRKPGIVFLMGGNPDHGYGDLREPGIGSRENQTRSGPLAGQSAPPVWLRPGRFDVAENDSDIGRRSD